MKIDALRAWALPTPRKTAQPSATAAKEPQDIAELSRPQSKDSQSLARQGRSTLHGVIAALGLGLVALTLSGCDNKPVHIDKKLVHQVAVAVSQNKTQARQLEKMVNGAEELVNLAKEAHQAWAQGEVAEDVPDGSSIVAQKSHRRGKPDIDGNPRIGATQAAPALSAGQLKSPQFLGTEQEYFHSARQIIENAKSGDRIALQMYEFENAATNGDKDAAKAAPGYADQQALLGDLTDAAKRGVDVDVVLDGSKHPKTKELLNGPIADALAQAARQTGHITLDIYPANTVNIDHAKELLYMTPASGGYAVQTALVGGTNWGNHTPANDDGGALFFGADAVGAAQVFYRDQAFSRGDVDSAPLPQQNGAAPVQWTVTSPSAEGGGSTSIKAAKLELTTQADAVYLNQFCLTSKDLIAASTLKAHSLYARLDPNELKVNQPALDQIRSAGGTAVWANTAADARMAGQKNHEKLDVYLQNGVAFAASIGSANDTTNGLESGYTTVNAEGKHASHKTNHEIDAIVHRFTSADGSYSTVPFLEAARTKTQRDFASVSLQDPPSHRTSTAPGNF